MGMATLVDKNAGLDVRWRPLCQEMVVTKNCNLEWERGNPEISAVRKMSRAFSFLYLHRPDPTAPAHTRRLQVPSHLKRLETEDGVELVQSKISKNPLERPLRTRTLGPAIAGRSGGGVHARVCGAVAAIAHENGTSTRVDLQLGKFSYLGKTWKSWSTHI